MSASDAPISKVTSTSGLAFLKSIQKSSCSKPAQSRTVRLPLPWAAVDTPAPPARSARTATMAKSVRAYCLELEFKFKFIGTFSCVHGNDALAATQMGRRCRDPLPIPEWRPEDVAPDHRRARDRAGSPTRPHVSLAGSVT